MRVFLKKAEKEDMKIIYQMQIEPLVGFALARRIVAAPKAFVSNYKLRRMITAKSLVPKRS